MNRVVNICRESFDVYMGRLWAGHARSPWHNPFRVGSGERGSAIEKFAVYFYSPEQKELRERALKDIPPGARLGCWCAPKRCHADIIAGYLEWKRGFQLT